MLTPRPYLLKFLSLSLFLFHSFSVLLIHFIESQSNLIDSFVLMIFKNIKPEPHIQIFVTWIINYIFIYN